jgi:hypothetical protein
VTRGAAVREWALLLLAGLTLGPVGLEAQGESPARAERLLEEGRFAEARAELEAWLAGEADAASRLERQHGIWLRALLTVDPGIAAQDYRRLVVEHPGGPFTDQALLRLALGARARGEVDEVDRYVGLLERDYPGSPHLAPALALLTDPLDGTAAVADGDPPEPSPRESPGGDAPVAEDLRFDSLGWAIELGAFAQEASARALARHAREAGLEVRLVRVPGSDLVHVRSGTFDGEEEAQVRARELRGRGFDAQAAPGLEHEAPLP